MPIVPSPVTVESISISSENTSPAGVTTSAGNLACATALVAGHLLRVLDDLLDRALQEEGALGQIVVLAGDDLVEAAHGLFDFHVRAGRARERFGDVERLRE